MLKKGHCSLVRQTDCLSLLKSAHSGLPIPVIYDSLFVPLCLILDTPLVLHSIIDHQLNITLLCHFPAQVT